MKKTTKKANKKPAKRSSRRLTEDERDYRLAVAAERRAKPSDYIPLKDFLKEMGLERLAR